MFERIREILEKYICPTAYTVGDKSKALGPGELDEDEKRLGELNTIWLRMLRDDPWAIKLRSHIRLLRNISGILFILFLATAVNLPRNSQVPSVILLVYAATIPYWFWIGRWNGRIEKKVFAEFKKRHGKYFHLR